MVALTIEKRVSFRQEYKYGRRQITSVKHSLTTLHIVNVYAPTFTKGGTTSYFQIRNIMFAFDDHLDSIQAFYSDLKHVLLSLLRNSAHSIVGGGFNDHYENSHLTREKLESLHLINLAYYYHNSPSRTYIPRGRSPCDQVWVSNMSKSDVTNFGFLPEYYFFEADNRGLLFMSAYHLFKIKWPPHFPPVH